MRQSEFTFDFNSVRIHSSCKDLMVPMFKFFIHLVLVIALAYVGKMVYDSNPTYGGYVILSLQWPIMQYSKDLATASREFIAALPSSMKRSLVCEYNSMSYKYILKWLNKAHAHHVINGLVVKDILPDGSMNVDIESNMADLLHRQRQRLFVRYQRVARPRPALYQERDVRDHFSSG